MNAPIVETLAIDNYERTRHAWKHITTDGGRIAKEFRTAESELRRVLSLTKEALLHNGICYTLDGHGAIQRVHNVRDIDRRD